MRIVLVAGGLLASVSALAQSAPAPLAQPGRFCVVHSLGAINDTRPSFTLDYGEPTKSNKLPDAEGYAKTFKIEALRSTADMLNYMDRTGWELVQTTAVAGSQGSPGTSLIEHQYIFRRKAGQ